MRKCFGVSLGIILGVFLSASAALAADAAATPVAGGENTGAPGEVTLKGMVLNEAHTGGREPSVVIYVLDGPPEVRAEFERIVAEYPAKGLDGDAARALLDRFTSRLMYYIDGPLRDKLHDDATYNARQARAVTGLIHEKDGRKWITASKCEDSSFQYPSVMLAPDKPLVMPDREPLVLKLNDQLSVKCIYVAPGKFLMGEPYYMCPHWQEDPPHMVTLTKGYYMAECPVTWEMYSAVTGAPAGTLNPLAPANLSCAEIYKFCRILSERSGRTVGMPTAAEWDYAARVGTSNPPFAEKFKDQASDATKPVKSKSPNAWGFYDMVSTGWERVSDGGNSLDREDTTDPRHVPPEDAPGGDPSHKHGHIAKGNAGYAVGEIEYIQSDACPPNVYPGVVRFRVVVQSEPASTEAAGAK